MWKGAADSKKTKRLSKHEIKKQLLESIIINEVVESEEFNKEAEEIQQPEEAAKVIKFHNTTFLVTSKILKAFINMLKFVRYYYLIYVY